MKKNNIPPPLSCNDRWTELVKKVIESGDFKKSLAYIRDYEMMMHSLKKKRTNRVISNNHPTEPKMQII